LIPALINDVTIGLNAFSTVFTLDVYVKKFHPQASQEKIKQTGRFVIIIAAFIAIVIALLLSTLNKGLFELSQAAGTYLAPPLSTVFLLGVLWKGATSKAANITLFAGSAICLTLGIMQITDFPYKGFWLENLPALFLLLQDRQTLLCVKFIMAERILFVCHYSCQKI